MIRLYGPSIGNASFARVTTGIKRALEEMGKLSGFVPIDAYDEEEVYSGYDAPIGLYVGPPSKAIVMSQIGWHKERLVMLAPNSSWLPESLFESLGPYINGFLSPSTWGADVIRGYTSLPVEVCPHGVSYNFVPNDKVRDEVRRSYKDGIFYLVHLASTTMERKGTRELIDAWVQIVRENKLGFYKKLTIVVDAPEGYYNGYLQQLAKSDKELNSIQFVDRLNYAEKELANYYSHFHGVVQPSRGEGFGLVPLEARACGVPVVMTSCTGHEDHAYESVPGARLIAHGVQLVMTGRDASIDDGPGAQCPSLSVEHLKMALERFYEHWLELEQEAIESAEDVLAEWNWTRVTKEWLEKRNK